MIGYTIVGDEGTTVGTLAGVLEGAQDTLIVATPAGELLVPFVRAWVGEVNTETRTIEIFNWRRLTDNEEIPPAPESDDH